MSTSGRSRAYDQISRLDPSRTQQPPPTTMPQTRMITSSPLILSGTDSRVSSLSPEEKKAYTEFERQLSEEEQKFIKENVTGKRAVLVKDPTTGATRYVYESLGVAGLTEPDKQAIAAWKQGQRNVFFEQTIPEYRKKVAAANAPQPLTYEQQMAYMNYDLNRVWKPVKEFNIAVAQEQKSKVFFEKIGFGEFGGKYSPFEIPEGFKIGTIKEGETGLNVTFIKDSPQLTPDQQLAFFTSDLNKVGAQVKASNIDVAESKAFYNRIGFGEFGGKYSPFEIPEGFKVGKVTEQISFSDNPFTPRSSPFLNVTFVPSDINIGDSSRGYGASGTWGKSVNVSIPTVSEQQVVTIAGRKIDRTKTVVPEEFPKSWSQKVVQTMVQEMGPSKGSLTAYLREGRDVLFPESKLGFALSSIDEYKRDTNFVTQGTIRPIGKTSRAAIDVPIGFVKGAESLVNPNVQTFSSALFSGGVSLIMGKGGGGYVESYASDIKGREGELLGEFLFEYASGKVISKGLDKTWGGIKQVPQKIRAFPSTVSNSRIAQNISPYINQASIAIKSSETYQMLDEFIFAPTKQVYTYGKSVVYPQLKGVAMDYFVTPAKNIFDYQFYYPVKSGFTKYVYQPTISNIETLRLYGGILKQELGKRTVGAIKTKVSNVTGLYGQYVNPYVQLVIKPYVSKKVDFAKAVFDDLVGGKIKLASQFYNVQIVGRTKAYAQLVIKPKFASISSSLSETFSPLKSIKPTLTKYTGIDKLTDIYREIKYGVKLKSWAINIEAPTEYAKYSGPQLVSDMDYFVFKDLMKLNKTPAQYKASTTLGYSTKRTLEDIFRESVELPNLKTFVIKPLTELGKTGTGTIIKSGSQALILETKQITKQATKQSTKSLLAGIVTTQTLKQLQKTATKTKIEQLPKQSVFVEYKPQQISPTKQVNKQLTKVNQLLKQEMILSTKEVQKQEQKIKSFPILKPITIQKIEPLQTTKQKIEPVQIQQPKIIPIQIQPQPQAIKITPLEKLAQPQAQKQQQPIMLRYRTLQKMRIPEEQIQLTEVKPQKNIFTFKLTKQKMKYPIKAPETLIGFKKIKAKNPFKATKSRRKSRRKR